MFDRQSRSRKIRRQAVDWLVRRGAGPLDAGEQRRFARWLDRSAAHRRAFAEAEAAWTGLGRIWRPPGVPTAHALAVAERPRRRVARVGATFAAAAAGLALLLGGTWFWYGDPFVALSADHRTRPGEVRRVALADGSLVELGSASAIGVAFDERRRVVRLLEGVAYFTVAADPARPFVVEAGAGTSEALGTQFMVERAGPVVDVAVAEHRVAVALRSPAGQQAELAAGRAVRYGPDGLGPQRAVDAAQVAAWRRGRLVFENQPVEDVVRMLNRYRRGRIVVADGALARRPITGAANVADIDRVVRAMADELGARVVDIRPFVTLIY